MHSFILPLSAVETNIQSILEELQRDPKPVKNDRRPLRSTGAAISIAVSLMEVSSIIIIIEDPRGSYLHVLFRLPSLTVVVVLWYSLEAHQLKVLVL